MNRNVEMTVLVANESKIVANFALVQPSAHVDGPRILQAISQVIGSDKKPDINNYLPNNQALQDSPIAIDPHEIRFQMSLNLRRFSTDRTEFRYGHWFDV